MKLCVKRVCYIDRIERHYKRFLIERPTYYFDLYWSKFKKVIMSLSRERMEKKLSLTFYIYCKMCRATHFIHADVFFSTKGTFTEKYKRWQIAIVIHFSGDVRAHDVCKNGPFCGAIIKMGKKINNQKSHLFLLDLSSKFSK